MDLRFLTYIGSVSGILHIVCPARFFNQLCIVSHGFDVVAATWNVSRYLEVVGLGTAKTNT